MNIYEAISNVMAEVGTITKASKNDQQGYMFRGIDAVYNALQPALIKNKVFVVPEVLEQSREERTSSKGNLLIYSILKVKFTFYAEDGTCVSAVVIGEGMDSGDKASNKAMSVAFKYACFEVFCIPTDEMKDPDAETHEVANNNKVESRHIYVLRKELKRTGISEKSMLESYEIGTIEEMSMDQFKNAMDSLKAKPDKVTK